MVAHLVRRYVFSLLFAPLLVYTLLVYITFPLPMNPHGYYPPVTEQEVRRTARELQQMMGDDRPWPLSYFSWLFDPDGYAPRDVTLRGDDATLPPGLDISLAGLHLRGAGALTGDLGNTLMIAKGTPVADMFGRGLGEYMLLVVLLLLGSMLVALRQRLGRPCPFRVASPVDPQGHGWHRTGRYTY